MLNQNKIAVVIPYYNASQHIVSVLVKLPKIIDVIYIIDDCGNETLPKEVLTRFQNVVYLKHDKNLGVGGATKTGFKAAIADKIEIVIKVDADDQMDTSYIEDLITPLLNNQADYSKGNRFRDFKALKAMPITRKIGNLCLSFLTKSATGYWNNFDPTNGFFAVKTETLENLSNNLLCIKLYSL